MYSYRRVFFIKINKKVRYIFWLFLFVFLIWFWFFSLPKPLFSAPTSTVLLSEDNRLLGSTIAADEQWRFPPSDSIPHRFKTCILQFEDAYFAYHPGVNPVSLGRALFQNLSSGKRISGGSTLTMQTIRLAKNNPQRTYPQKFLEIIQAFRLELSHSKKKILTFYSSNAPFGGNVVGLEAASWRYYGKLSHQLSWGESATLAVLPNAPSLIYPGKNQEKLKAKRNRLLYKLLENKHLTKQDYELALIEPLPQAPHALPNKAYHLLHTLSREYVGQRINSTIDYDMQDLLRGICQRHHETLAQNQIYNLAAVVVEVETGNVKAYVGNSEGTSKVHSPAVDIVQSARSSGSILKPLLYSKMLKTGKLLPKMLLDDTPSDITENYIKTYDGVVPADEALARSLNIPALQMLRMYGTEKFLFDLRQMGFSTLNREASNYGLSLIVGGAEVSLWDLARAYRNMAHTIKHPEKPTFQTSIQAQEKVNEEESASPFQPQSTFLTAEAMQQLGRPDSEIGWKVFRSNSIAWKTGTSHGFKDAWAVGFDPEYVVAVWAGNADGEGRPGLVGVKAAAPLMFNIFNNLPQSGNFERPTKGWKKVKTCSKSGYKFTPDCKSFVEVLVPEMGVNAPSCPYHRTIHLDESERFMVNSSCYPQDKILTKKQFVLPPVQAYYYQKINPSYQGLPELHPDCQSQESQFDFIYPKNFTRIFLPRNAEGQRQQLVFRIAHKDPSQELNWYLNKDYLGSTKHTHDFAVQPEVGKHTITVIDIYGNQITKDFEVL